MTACLAAVVVSPTWLVTSAIIVVAGLVVLLLERALPYRRDWKPTRRDWVQGLAYVVASSAIAGGLQALLTRGEPVAMSLGERAAWIVGGLLVMDAASYLVHRVLHRTRLLWPVHAVHHGLPRVWFLNALHNHVLDIALSTGLALLPLYALGFPPEVVGAVGALTVAHAWFQHANADLRLGWLNRVIAGPELHRWHHSINREESDANYGFVFAIWDVLLGTWRAPGTPAQIGVRGAPPMDTLVEQAIAPFRGR
ncbi:MAG: sterol desaturase family protein [Deltaproteobacteria bacterium]|nr:sterol desaturase family protein [Deltaproteobacteria bacterium]